MSSELVEAINEVFQATRFTLIEPCTREDYAALVNLLGTVTGLARGAGLDPPPALEEADLMVHDTINHTRGQPPLFVPCRGHNLRPPQGWEERLSFLRAAAQALAQEAKASAPGALKGPALAALEILKAQRGKGPKGLNGKELVARLNANRQRIVNV